LKDTVGATSPNPQVVVVRALAPLVEPAMQVMQQVWKVWRAHFWRLPAVKPRIWAM
jgi:urease accessory protein